MKTSLFFRTLAMVFLAGLFSPSQDITEVTWATPDWEGLSSKNGTGLYHEVMAAVYGRIGIKVVVEYTPWARALAEAESGAADFTGGDSLTERFTQPKIPIFRNVEKAFYRKSAIPRYTGISDLDHKEGVWVRGYTDNIPEDIKRHLEGTGNNSREGAVQMVLSGRADYYFDNDFQMPQTLMGFKGKYKPGEFGIGTVYIDDLFLCFTKSARGQRLADLFDQGMKRLAASGELKRIYTKWKRSVPPVE